jgi:hypothetical protein
MLIFRKQVAVRSIVHTFPSIPDAHYPHFVTYLGTRNNAEMVSMLVFLVVMPHNIVRRYQRFEEHMKMKAACSP